MERIYCHIIPPIWTIRHPDMAAAFITSYVRHHGYEVHLVDLNAELYNLEQRPLVRDCWERLFVAMDPTAFLQAIIQKHEVYIRQRLQEILEQGCEIFGMLLLDGTAKFVAWLSKMIKEMAPEAHVVVGGTGATSVYRLRRRYGMNPPITHPVDQMMDQGHAIDTWVLGEGEETLLELLTRLRAKEDLHGVRGLALTEDGPFAPFKERALIKDLGALPLATFEGFDLELYQFEALPFQLSRGCAFARCSHCGLKGYSRGFRVRPPEHAIAELSYLIERYGVREFHFTDLGVNGDLDKLEAFCDAVINHQLEIRWQSFVQIRGDMSPRLMEKIVRSGCTSLNYGFESGSDLVLGLMRKPYTAEEAARVLKMTREAGGKGIINIMCGHPGETEEEFSRTLDFLADNVENIAMVASVGYTSVHIHSPLLDECETFGIEVDSRGGWACTDGANALAMRNERVHRVTEKLRVLGIPCFEAFWEADRDDAGPLKEEDIWLNFTSVRIVTPEGNFHSPYDASSPLFVQVGYGASPNISRVVFDLKIRDLQGKTVFITPQTSESLRAIRVREAGWIQMALCGHDLLPGKYLLSVRAHLMHQEEDLDFHLRREVLEVLGEPAERVTVMTPYTWTHHQGVPAQDPCSPVLMMRLLDEANQESATMGSGRPMTVAVGVDQRGLEDVAVFFRILNNNGKWIYESERQPLEPGETGVGHLVMESLDLMAGFYEVELLIGTREKTFSSRHMMEVAHQGVAQESHKLDLFPWTRWEEVGAIGAPSDGQMRILSMALNQHNRAQDTFTQGSRGTVSVVITGLSRGLNRVQCHVWITDDEQTVSAIDVESMAFSSTGAMRVQVNLQLNLQQRDYQVHAALWNLAEERIEEPVWSTPLRISS